MCLWHQLHSHSFDLASGVSSSPRWTWKCSVLCRPLLESFNNAESKCSVLHQGRRWLPLLPQKANLCLVLSVFPLCPFSVGTLHPFRAGRGVCVWASASPFPPLGTERGEESTDETHTPPLATGKRSVHLQSIHPSIMCEMTHIVMSKQRSWLKSGRESGFISKAAPHCHLDCSSLQESRCLFSFFSSYTWLLLNNTGSLQLLNRVL